MKAKLTLISLAAIGLLQACSTTTDSTAKQTPTAVKQQAPINLQPATLFANLPDSCPNPDAFAIAPDSSLTLSCPNYASKKVKGMLLNVTADGSVTEIGKIKTKNGFAQPMGLAYAPDGSLYVCDNAGRHKGSLLKVTLNGNKIASTEVIATGMSSPNGVRYQEGNLYVSQLRLPKAKTANMSSGIYRFSENDRNVKVASDLTSEHLIFSRQTENKSRQFGLDGLVFDSKGDLLVGDFGDAIIYKLRLDQAGKVVEKSVFAELDNSVGIDGLAIDKADNVYLAGFLKNEIYKVTASGKISLLAQYSDNNGANGEIDQPADLIVYQDKLVISNFDLMKGKGIVNKGHGKPYTISAIEL
ncbi:SMP-30/gluconolactonase/LRE family protein [Algibacillus agarilyticus]|uniref:SMP-30/gluconolactonase/LRE family protein n=1 Tax=Algibacillus agarilyticus TaxID=2234133 RepID=UPI000DD0AED1|nr:SMP-30/gluconolactonase/LRE family protein [Algibacillus agarilyticus]